METSTITEQVRAFVTNNYLLGQGDRLRDEQSFLESGIIDSTGVLELVSFLEEQFGITVEEEELTPDNLDSVSFIAAYLERKLKGAANAEVYATENVVQA